jgi:hypothetical protein
MSDRTNHRRVLHFAVTGVLLGGAVGCASNEPKGDAKAEQKPKTEQKTLPPQTKQPEELKFAPNPGPNELEGKQPEVAPTTAVKPDPVVDDIEVNEGPVKEPEPDHVNVGPEPEPKPEPKPEPEGKAAPEKRVNPGPVEELKPPLKVNPGPER